MRLKKAKTALLVRLLVLAACLLQMFMPHHAWAADLETWPGDFASRQTGVDFSLVSRSFPRLKTLVLTRFSHGLGLNDIARLRELGAFPQSGGSLGLLGQRWAVLFTRAENLEKLRQSPLTVEAVPLSRFRICGIYRVGFKLVDEQYHGTLDIKISMPRSGFGKKLSHLEVLVSPYKPYEVEKDNAGNSWLKVRLLEAKNQDSITCSFYFIYNVQLAALLEHALAMTPMDEFRELPLESPARVFLPPSAKITSNSQQIVSLAREIIGDQKAPRSIYRSILAYIKKNLPYDREKREMFFGGRMAYSDMADMYNRPEATLANAKAACPSTSILEAALLRAAGVPARTAGRWGHFYTELFMPGRGWLSTSVTPTGIPLVLDIDSDHQPFAAWSPKVMVQTTQWTGQVKVLMD